MQQAIAILDSGVGGLTVVKEVMRQLPQEKIIYFGDTSRAPYGSRSAEEVRLFTRQIVDYLLQYSPKMIVIACNTATAAALEHIRDCVNVPVIGVIHPGARAAIKASRNGIIGVIGTEGTIRSRAYDYALKLISPQVKVISAACPSFVPLVEKGMYMRSGLISRTVEEGLQQMKGMPLDCLILGCTHYPFLSGAISDVMGPTVTLISSADETAREVSAILYHKGQMAKGLDSPIHQFFCSGEPVMFQKIAQQWLGKHIELTPVVWQVSKII